MRFHVLNPYGISTSNKIRYLILLQPFKEKMKYEKVAWS